MYMYILAAYTRCCPANVNMKHRRHSNFGLVGPLISFWQPKQLPVGLANTKAHPLQHPHAVINVHPITWTPYAKFQPDWSIINEFLVVIMMFYGCGNDKTTPIDTQTDDKLCSPSCLETSFQISVWLVISFAFNSQNNFQWVWL